MKTSISNEFLQFLKIREQIYRTESVQAVLAMSEEGATVPFMARYRKEKTGNLDEVQIRSILDYFAEYSEVTQRREFVLKELEKQSNLTAEIKERLVKAHDLTEIEEIYRPYKKKKKTKATIAREAGLADLADWIWSLGQGETEDKTPLEIKGKEFVSAAKGFATYEEVLRGAQHILVEKLSNLENLREAVRQAYMSAGSLTSAPGLKYKAHSKFETYAKYSEPVKNLFSSKTSHRYLAVRRGWQEGELKVSIEADETPLIAEFEKVALRKDSQASLFLKDTVKQALRVHVIPSIVNELHTKLKTEADNHAITVFAENVRRVLMGSPFGAKVVLGVDPGLRTGCKVALVDRSGAYISHTVIKMQGESAVESTTKLFKELLSQVKVDAIAVGNGTGGREAEVFLRNILKSLEATVPVVMISESGASVYSASEVAREEFADLDLTVRGAISIARRLQDPLAELVKIEPKSIGVGQYQHDLSQPKLKKSLHDVVESCVNRVGVDLNTASSSLLQYVAGIGPALAKNITIYRKDKGLFKDRSELLTVPQFSTKAFEQAAGFLRVFDGKNFLDQTGVHPERYSAVREMAQELGEPVQNLTGEKAEKLLGLKDKWSQLVGEFTFNDIYNELKAPGRDPRDPFKVFEFRSDIHEVKDLEPAMICPGIVTNVTNFGAFVDIGVHQDGLVHISELSQKFVDDPHKVVAPGDQVKVRVLKVDPEKKQISLSMKLTEAQPAERAQRPRPQRQRPTTEAKRETKEGGEREPRRERPQGPRRAGSDNRRANSVNSNRGPRPTEADSSGPRAQGARNQGPSQPDRSGRGRDSKPNRGDRGGHQGAPRRPSQPFNNPFAALTSAGDTKK